MRLGATPLECEQLLAGSPFTIFFIGGEKIDSQHFVRVRLASNKKALQRFSKAFSLAILFSSYPTKYSIT